MTARPSSATSACMWPYHPDLLATPVPRYTSFPTAAEFTPDVGPDRFAEAVATATGDVSLYLHIPYCEHICWYCGCNTGAANKAQRLTSYLTALHREIALVAGLLPASTRVRRIAFGGGSPNAIAPTDFIHLMEALVIHFPLDDPTISIELDPRAMSPTWGDVVAGVGATQASLGVQTFAPHLQAAIGRIQPVETIEASVETLRRGGIRSLNFDLMYGLPGQTQDDLADTLDRTVRFGADRIALFGYAHVPHLIPRQRRIDDSALPGQAERFRMAALGHRTLVEAGYVPIGFDHFALPDDPIAQAARAGRLRRNFQGFTDDGAPALIGLGASAISSFPSLLAQNEKNSGRYRMLLSHDILPIALGKARDVEDRRRGAVISELLCHGRARADKPLVDEAWERLAPYVEAGLCSFDHGAVAIPPEGLPYARSIAAAFDPYRQHSPRRFSSAV